MTEPAPKSEDSDLFRAMVIERDACTPYAFRKETGKVAEVFFVATRAMQLIHETLAVARVLQEAIGILQKDGASVDWLRVAVRSTAPGSQLLSGNLHPLHAIVVINLCAALEAGIDDTLVAAMRFRPGIVERLNSMGVAKLPNPVDRDLTYDEAQIVVRRLKAFTRTEKIAPAGWLRQLNAIGLVIELDEADRRAIREMVYVRNCIVHRAHRADEDCETAMAILEAKPGHRILLTREAMREYASASISIASSITKAAQAPFVV